MLACQLRIRTKLLCLTPPAKRFDSAMRAELLEDLTLELVDSPKSYAHSIRDLLVRDSFIQILHELILPCRQRPATRPTTPSCLTARLRFSSFRPWPRDAERQRGQ